MNRSAPDGFSTQDIASVRSGTLFLRWWWRVFCTVLLLVLLWLGTCAWLSRPAAPWVAGWAGWWSGDRSDWVQPSSLHAPNTGTAAEVIAVDGDSAMRTSAESLMDLGHLGYAPYQLSLSGWERVLPDQAAWPDCFLAVWIVEADRMKLMAGLMPGTPVFGYHAGTDPEPGGVPWRSGPRTPAASMNGFIWASPRMGSSPGSW